ncbi:MAG: hypothetical protein HY675_02550 [Chloroflexi bacterium]|nr:hypothetical protein [Chloroflexota bacterium]
MQHDRINRIVGYALTRREAYLIVGLVFVAVIVAIVGRWPGWVVLASVTAGVVLLGLLVVDSLADPDAERDAAIVDIDLGQVNDPELKARVRKALDYVRAAQRLARRDTDGTMDAADDELPQLEQAARSIYQMSLRLQEFRADRLLQQDLAELHKRRSGRGQLSPEQEAQLGTLERLGDLTHSAEREIEGALAQLGRSYAEMQAIKVTPEFRGRAADALGQLEASTKRLADLAEGYDEVYGGRPLPGGS